MLGGRTNSNASRSIAPGGDGHLSPTNWFTTMFAASPKTCASMCAASKRPGWFNKRCRTSCLITALRCPSTGSLLTKNSGLMRSNGRPLRNVTPTLVWSSVISRLMPDRRCPKKGSSLISAMTARPTSSAARARSDLLAASPSMLSSVLLTSSRLTSRPASSRRGPCPSSPRQLQVRTRPPNLGGGSNAGRSGEPRWSGTTRDWPPAWRSGRTPPC